MAYTTAVSVRGLRPLPRQVREVLRELLVFLQPALSHLAEHQVRARSLGTQLPRLQGVVRRGTQMVVTGYTVPRTLATQFRPCHLYGKRDTRVTRLTLRAPVPASAQPRPRVWTVQNFHQQSAAAAKHLGPDSQRPLRPRCLWSDSRSVSPAPGSRRPRGTGPTSC